MQITKGQLNILIESYLLEGQTRESDIQFDWFGDWDQNEDDSYNMDHSNTNHGEGKSLPYTLRNSGTKIMIKDTVNAKLVNALSDNATKVLELIAKKAQEVDQNLYPIVTSALRTSKTQANAMIQNYKKRGERVFDGYKSQNVIKQILPYVKNNDLTGLTKYFDDNKEELHQISRHTTGNAFDLRLDDRIGEILKSPEILRYIKNKNSLNHKDHYHIEVI